MNIAHLLPYSASFPLEKHNGRYEWALRLARLQAADDHTVTVYCGPSTDQDPSILWRTLAENMPYGKDANITLMQTAFSDLSHEVFHSHFDDLHFYTGAQTTRPIVVTQHWFPTDKIATAAKQYPGSNIHTVPVTKLMKNTNDYLKIPSENVIYHGIDLSLFVRSEHNKVDKLLYVGRIAPHKGLLETVQLVSMCGERLDIVGKINKKDAPYWEQIKPYVDEKNICYLGTKTQAQVALLMAHSRALLFLPTQAEAFGQTIIEAQACGTPVLLNDLGANSELMLQGKTGFLVKTPKDFKNALAELSTISPTDCREFAEKFDVKVMAQNYTNLYLAV